MLFYLTTRWVVLPVCSPLCTLWVSAVLQALAGSAQSLIGQIHVSLGSSLMVLVVFLLLTQARANFSSLWLWE